jgi:tRNA threonylcarbamoyladenosine biosynthesis protein TsaB
MRILALETSTEYCSVALHQDGNVIERFEWVGQKHSELLIAMLADLLRDAQVKLAELDGIAFGAGPGSFTGVRIACGATQGLALGADLPVLGVCTLQALAQASSHTRVIAALDARMGEIYHAVYEQQQGVWMTVSEPCLCKAEDAPMVSGMDWYGVGSGFAAYGEALQQRYAGQLQGTDGRATCSRHRRTRRRRIRARLRAGCSPCTSLVSTRQSGIENSRARTDRLGKKTQCVT